MAVYAYVGVQRGKKIKGQMDAPTVNKARAELRAQRIRIKKIKEKKPKSKSGLNMDITWGPFGDILAKEIMLFS